MFQQSSSFFAVDDPPFGIDMGKGEIRVKERGIQRNGLVQR